MWDGILAVIGWWLVCVIAVERTTEVITTSEIFAPLRNYLAKRATSDDSGPLYVFISKVFTCGWCFSVWASIVFTPFLPGNFLSLSGAGGRPIIHYIPIIAALFGLSNLWHAIFRRVHRGMVHTIDLNVPESVSLNLVLDIDESALESLDDPEDR